MKKEMNEIIDQESSYKVLNVVHLHVLGLRLNVFIQGNRHLPTLCTHSNNNALNRDQSGEYTYSTLLPELDVYRGSSIIELFFN